MPPYAVNLNNLFITKISNASKIFKLDLVAGAIPVTITAKQSTQTLNLWLLKFRKIFGLNLN